LVASACRTHSNLSFVVVHLDDVRIPHAGEIESALAAFETGRIDTALLRGDQ
jgi:hypothetical protein